MIARLIHNALANISLNLSTLSLVRAVFAVALVWLITQRVLPWFRVIRGRCRTIDQIPGPQCFNAILGNVPLAILKNIISESQESKNLLVSK